MRGRREAQPLGYPLDEEVRRLVEEGTKEATVNNKDPALPEQAGWAVEMHGACLLFANNAEKAGGASPGATTRVYTEAQVQTAVATERERCAKVLDLRASDLMLIAGNMTAGELRTVMAILDWLKGRMTPNV